MDRYPNSLMFVEELEKTESSKNMIPMIIGAVAAIVVICGIAFAVMSKGDKTETGTKVEVVDKPEDDGNGDKTIPPDNKKTTPGNLENEPENAEAEKRAAEKRAADKREAEKLAKGNSEFMKKQRRKKLADMADAFELRLDEVKEKDGDVAALFKEDLAKVKELEKADKFVESLAAWEKIKDNLENYDNKLTEKLKEKAVAKKKQVEKYRKKVKQWEKLDNTIGNILMKYDVNFSSSNDLLEQKEFAKAEKKYEKCLGYLKSIETLVKTKLTAKKGKDFALAGVDLELKWVNTMSMWVGKYEVTNSQYRAFKPLHSSKKYQGLSMDRANQPVCEISYNDAAGYCIWLTDKAHSSGLVPETLEFRLPTKAEWQAAAACGDDRKFPWGKDWPAKFGNFGNQEIFPNDWKLEGYVDKFPVTCDVSKSGKNKWDIYGLSGNLWEWTSEEKDRKRAVYGGAWSSCSKGELAIKISGSNYANPQEKYDNIGFRVVLATAKED
ncbi:MAG: SUMF1/EgtB/PvdO family nonheme iron enzyme [Lentisphaeria bacterium]|nr:SUMF1/EgtB/PvdO family nonheme iron enzyme [Lentisphaeria bacterium]